MNEVGELRSVADEEHGCVITYQVEVPLLRIELQRETARIAIGVRIALLARNCGKPSKYGGLPAHLTKEIGVSEPRDIPGDLEKPVGAASFCVNHPLRHPLPVDVLHLLDQVVDVEHGGSRPSDGQRVLVALGGDA
jgi:hypothetical protein